MCLQPSSEVTGTFSAGNRFPKTVFLVKGAAELDGLHDRQNEGNMPQGANEVELVICVESTIQEVEVCHYNNTDDTLKRTSQQVDLIVINPKTNQTVGTNTFTVTPPQCPNFVETYNNKIMGTFDLYAKIDDKYIYSWIKEEFGE